MKKYLILCITLFTLLSANAQLTLRITQAPRYYTPLTDTLFLAGTINNWDSANMAHRFIKQTDGTYLLTLPLSVGQQIEYKVTRGNWNSVETQLNGSYLPNRTYTYSTPQTVDIQVENWNDMLGWHTSVGNTFIIDSDFYMPQLNRYRRIWIYLPQDYFSTINAYPVVYMHDAQNLFDAVYAPFGEWNVDSTMEALFGLFSPSAIIVGVDHGGNNRINEYAPWVNGQYGGGEGELYAQFIVNTLKPFIDATFRTMPNRENTCIGGSSMGGLISLYTALNYPAVFSKAAIFSPSFWFSDTLQQFMNTVTYSQAQRFYFLAGQNESSTMVSDMQAVAAKLVQQGFPASYINTVIKSDGQHSEWFWKREFGDAFSWLFQFVTATKPSLDTNKMFYDNLNNQLCRDAQMQEGTVYVFDMSGRLYKQSNDFCVGLAGLPQGVYLALLLSEGKHFTKHFFVP